MPLNHQFSRKKKIRELDRNMLKTLNIIRYLKINRLGINTDTLNMLCKSFRRWKIDQGSTIYDSIAKNNKSKLYKIQLVLCKKNQAFQGQHLQKHQLYGNNFTKFEKKKTKIKLHCQSNKRQFIQQAHSLTRHKNQLKTQMWLKTSLQKHVYNNNLSRISLWAMIYDEVTHKKTGSKAVFKLNT